MLLRAATVEAFSDDLRRMLDGFPVTARPDSIGYRVRKFVRRHRIGVTATAVTVIAVLLGAVGTTVGFIRATAAESEARSEAETSRAVTGFMIQIFEEADPGNTRGDKIMVSEVLDTGVNNTKQAIFRAVHKLRDALAPAARSL